MSEYGGKSGNGVPGPSLLSHQGKRRNITKLNISHVPKKDLD